MLAVKWKIFKKAKTTVQKKRKTVFLMKVSINIVLKISDLLKWFLNTGAEAC